MFTSEIIRHSTKACLIDGNGLQAMLTDLERRIG